MVDIPPPPADGGEEDSGDGRAAEERLLLAEHPDIPILAADKIRYQRALINIKLAFLASVRGICYLLPWVVFGLLCIWLVHVVGPLKWRWMAPEEVSHLQALLFSGAVSALATAIATKHV